MSAIDTDLATTLRERRGAVDAAMSRDRGRLLGLWSRWQGKPGNPQLRQAFEQALAASQAQRQARAAQQPAITLDTQLPIAREADRIIALIRDHPVVVIAGETGSGKTTQLPKLCLAAGRGAAGMIGCTQPRRIAARAVAARVAEELNTPLGTTVGFQVRFTDRVGEDSRIKFMTDGILLAEIASDRWLSAYDTIIVDEAHERSLNIDFLLGYLKQLLRKRPDLKLIVTSATIDTERFSRHFDDAPVINVEGRTFPVEVRYRPLEGESGDGDTGDVGRDGERTVNDAIVAAIDEITRIDPHGDVLMFLPGEREIRDAHQSLERRKYRETEVVPLYARLSAADQDRVFNPGPRRRLVLATNVAETSLTVPRIRYVVDPGYARVKRYSPRQKLDRLHIEPISQASANQRMGRCGRIAEGICYRLYAEADFAARPAFTDPEIRRASLSGVILRMLQLGLGRIEEFPFLEAPDERAVADGWQQLLELGAIDAERRLTSIGRQMARLPVDVKLARMLVAAQQHGCLREMIIIAAFLGIQDPRERPPEAREAADNAHALFADARSEFVGILRLWDAYRQVHEDLTQSKLRDWCGRHFLGFLRMREWRELHRQLRLLCEELGWSEEPAGAMLAPLLAGASAPVREDGQAHRATRGQLHRAARLAREGKPDPAAPPAQAKAAAAKSSPADATDAAVRTTERERAAAYQALHRALLAGLPTQIGHRTEKGDFLAARQRRFVPFPGSALARKPPPWILAATLLDTQKVWGMTNAAIEPDWAIAELPHLLARKHFDPHWSRAQGQVVASEQISLFGLVLAPKKPVHFGKIDPATSHDLFVRQGLVPGEINTRAAFVADNLKVLEQAREEEAKLRRAGIVADEDWQARWYLDRIPAELHSASGLDAWWKTLPADKRRSLHWSLNDLLPGEGSEADRFPKYFALGDARLPLQYRFEPGAIDDGVTLEVPLHLLNALDPSRLSWLAPGFVADKASALIRSLPKAQRRNYVPAPDYGRAFYEAFSTPSADDMRGELARFLSKATGAPVAALDFDEEALDTHLLMNLRLRDEDGRVLAESRDLVGLRARFGERAGQAFAARAGRALAAEGLRDFPATPIPEQVAGEAGVPAYPALVDQGEDAALRIFADRNEALRAHPRGVRRLLEIALADKIKQARKQLPVSPKTGLLYAAIESQERLRGDLVDAALNAVLAEGLGAIRDPAAFAQRREDAVKRLFGEAMARLTLAESILGAVAELKPLLEAPLMGWARGNLDDMEQQLRALVHAGFLRDTPADALANYPRYLKAMILRTERAKRDPARDQARMLELKPFVDALNDAAARGLQQHPDWQALRWDLEELRVSVFAQELGAKSGVSAKKLSQRVAALRG
ncbi:ATP-dependent RNA helicase HrpA [Xanthomonas campestris]|uniref:ATP-dependent RNA helicase HrpA n=1 Tax=Xanthomonas campestris TaxID=339 RepID=UPI0021F7F93A|nr:ATP-dependent RNA helicase HrpA [Xanthomonas campestris]UYP79084.1 ATP-dependent RNA helicase HrpA [Xanthomonas campestris pv. campestris]